MEFQLEKIDSPHATHKPIFTEDTHYGIIIMLSNAVVNLYVNAGH